MNVMKLISSTLLALACVATAAQAAPAAHKAAASPKAVVGTKKNPALRGEGTRKLNQARRERMEKMRVAALAPGQTRALRGCGCSAGTTPPKPKRSSRSTRQTVRTAQQKTARQANSK